MRLGLLAFSAVALYQMMVLQQQGSLLAPFMPFASRGGDSSGMSAISAAPRDLPPQAISVPAASPLLPLVLRGPLSFPAEGPLGDMTEFTKTLAVMSSDETVDFVGGEGALGGQILDKWRSSGESGECNDVHPNADSPEMLHVIFACDPTQVEGIQGSVSSVVSTATAPDELTVHIMVQTKHILEFKERFGLRPECQGSVTVTGVLVRVHAVDGGLIERAVAKVSASVRAERGAIDSLENFARFYMHLILERAVVVYLDADTIVQADLGQLRKQLVMSNKTVGFVARDKSVLMEKFLKTPKNCKLPGRWKDIMKMPAYNVGVFVVNLQRWKELRMAERVEHFVGMHNQCDGKLWVGGSQPPLLLAFLSVPEGKPQDYIVYDAAWNAVDLGWRSNINPAKLKKQFVLHWNGKQKPWKDNGLYREFWLPHRERFSSLMQPYDSGDTATKVGAGQAILAPAPALAAKSSDPDVFGRKRYTTTSPSPEQVVARAACPTVEVLEEFSSEDGGGKGQTCVLGRTFGCGADAKTMWTSDGCQGIFSVSGDPTVCGRPSGAAGLDVAAASESCGAGRMLSPSHSCSLMIVTSFFTTKKDWQRGKLARPSFEKIEKLYQSTMILGLNVTVVYDDLPDTILNKYGCSRFQFAHVSLSDFDKRYGLNDVRYFFFDRLLQANPQWQAVFVIDAFDVRVRMNPCSSGIHPGKLYVGSERERLKGHPWMKVRFKKLGVKYGDWYNSLRDRGKKIFNCGITGGRRDVMLRLFRRMTDIISDPELSVRQMANEDINVNMASLNYIAYNDFAGSIVTGVPLHSAYKRLERKRRDVWFVHK